MGLGPEGGSKAFVVVVDRTSKLFFDRDRPGRFPVVAANTRQWSSTW